MNLNEIDEEIKIWQCQIILEELGGNIVKENFARGKVAGLRAAKYIIQQVIQPDQQPDTVSGDAKG